ncbi:helicase-exonuclease AddAB subunit AddB [Butyrivibrio sp. XB500-5]|uniref:PD-(D/E)XK nuclease family protein n=1 Tax=Butyrivibrio sp. XB500-5 TaxID=2364880 RepID=UPI000EA8C19C|nr:PD-(D/E)XK nuclease family protein [Butyrivibrio sp. XB500-5]RKM63268.1 helicase-exonuclease AddAB subunit AddB [Butyrivibrio sp. XB500-5]
MLRFCFGASGSGKSTGLIKEIIDKSLTDVGTDFLLIVPDQFTMQTQKDVVRMHPSHAIMNIDVLSFGRLSHRVFEETSKSSFSVLDDVGKSLVLRRVADILGDRLKVIGKNMHKPGYIDEVKSTISEFMQYGISDDALATLENESGKKAALNSKIKDLRLLYSEFLRYIQGKFITTEETLDILCKAIPNSSLLKDSVIVFDGFTGFTPIQYRVIKELMRVSKEVCVSLTIGPEEDPYAPSFEEQELFMLTKKTVLDLEKAEYLLLKETSVIAAGGPDFEAWRNIRNAEMSGKAGGDIFIKDKEVKRLEGNPPLAFLEQNLFRFNSRKYTDKQDSIQLFEAQTLEEEVRQTMIKIRSLVTGKGYAYRDIAVVCGNLGSYANLIKRAAAKFDIPVYIDQNTGLMLNPFIEYITSAINIVISGYRYEDVFHYMRSGMTDFSKEDTDLLENYVRALGIKGRSAWEDRFMRRMPARFSQRSQSEDTETKELELVEKLEGMRASISAQLKPLFDAKEGTAVEITDALLKMIEENACSEKLLRYKEKFEKLGDIAKAKEYDQVYGKVIDILMQISALIGEDKLDIKEYKDILSVGFGDIEVGTIPQDVDRVIVGDIERTRLREIKALLFMGVNDGSIPSSTGGGGILSDMDRQFLLELDTGVELAPTPRQQMYIQRLYLYMNLTKPTDKLYLSFSELDNDGKSVRPAYLISKIMSLYEGMEIDRPEDAPFEEQTSCIGDSLGNLAELMREFSLGILDDRKKTELSTLYEVVKNKNVESESNKDSGMEKMSGGFVQKLTEAAFKHYEDRPLAKNIALALYGANLENSVSRLEKFASCCYAHFLRYGLGLSEREEFDFDSSDLGKVFHEVLEKYTGEIIRQNISWKDLSKEESDKILNQALTECIDAYGETILLSNARNEYMAERIKRILTRTVDTLKYQISKGNFEPAHVEMDFREAGKIEEINIALTEDEKHNIIESMNLHGRIDRIDLCEDSDHVYVKVIDFKSGGKKLSLASLYYGLQLQLVLYMNVAKAVASKKSGGKEVVPAAILYYHVEDPMVKGSADLQPDVINQEIIKELKTTGLVNENREIINMLDSSINGASDVIPVGFTKSGDITAASSTVTNEDYSAISGFVDKKIREFGKNILNGDIKVNPYEMNNRDACKYCSYKGICGFDDKIPGYSKRELDLDDKDAMERIRNES